MWTIHPYININKINSHPSIANMISKCMNIARTQECNTPHKWIWSNAHTDNWLDATGDCTNICQFRRNAHTKETLRTMSKWTPQTKSFQKVNSKFVINEKWSHSLTIIKLLMCIMNLLSKPDVYNPLITDIAKLYQENREEHDLIAKEWTQRYAK